MFSPSYGPTEKGCKTVVLQPFSLSCSKFPPHHLIDHAGVGLDDLDHLGRNILIGVVRHGRAVVAAAVHLNSGCHRLQQALPVDAGKDKARLVQRLGALEVRMHTAGNGLPMLVKNELSSGSVPLSDTTQNAFICR